MAKAQKIPTDYEVRLTLTREEAEALRDVCAKIGGGPLTRRRHFDRITRVLYDAGVHETTLKDWAPNTRTIYFK